MLNSIVYDKSLDYCQEFQMKCFGDVTTIQRMTDKERVFDFLVGLNVEFDQIKVQVLGWGLFPSLQQTFSYVKHEEIKRNSMLQPNSSHRFAMTLKIPLS